MRLSQLYVRDVLLEKVKGLGSKKRETAHGYRKGRTGAAQAMEPKKKYEETPFARALQAQAKEQEEIADRVDVDPSTVSRWKSRTRKPSFDNLRKAVKAVGTQASTLWPELKV